MFKFLRKKSPQRKTGEKSIANISKVFRGLSKTRERLTAGLADIFLGKKQIDQAMLDQLEELLITADLGLQVTNEILAELTSELSRKALSNPEELILALQQKLTRLLKPCDAPSSVPTIMPKSILVVGVNGAGKTTTIGKLAHYFQQQGLTVVLAAGDTFRAAGIEQLTVWGERLKTPVISQHLGADSASVIYDSLSSAKARGAQVLIADTAGRLHTKDNLMQELAKIKKVMQKHSHEAPHETWLVLDATVGQNGLTQAQHFHKAIDLTGIILTKLDGTAKGGIVFTIVNTLKLPIRYIGVGEQMDDLRPFDPKTFVKALFEEG